MSISHAPRDPAGQCLRGNGKQNVQTLFVTPGGEIFHVATGYLDGEDLAREAKFAGRLFDQIRDLERDAAVEKVVEAHRQRLADEGFSASEVAARNPIESMMSGMARMNRNGVGMGMQGVENMFSEFSRQQELADNQFSIQHPLMSRKRLERDPTPLVGNGKSFFASSSSSSN